MASKMDTETHYSDVWVVIPAFNEAAVIGKVVTDVRSVFDHVVCVDDGSTDGTGDIARRSGAHLVRHPINLGQGAAIQTGIEYARKQPGARSLPPLTATASTASKTWPQWSTGSAQVTSMW